MTDRGVCKVSFGIGLMPGRKRVALYRACGVSVRTLAYFDSEDEAREFMQFIDRLALYPSHHEPADEEWHGWAEVER